MSRLTSKSTLLVSLFLVLLARSFPFLFEVYAAPTEQVPSVVFEDVTTEVGLAFNGAQFGGAWGDYDSDGWPDLFANHHLQDPPGIYRNNGNGTFTDMYNPTVGIMARPDESAGVKDPHGSCWGDYNGNGQLDLYITTGPTHINPLYAHQGSDVFKRIAGAGVDDLSGRGRSCNWIDYDRDGDLDLFVTNETSSTQPSNRLFRNNGNGSFTNVSSASGLAGAYAHGNAWGDYDRDGDLDVIVTGNKPFRLYRNNGNGTFTNVTSTAKLTARNQCWAADFGDYDNDGWVDLYVACGRATFFDNVDVEAAKITYTSEATGEHDGLDFVVEGASAVTFDVLSASENPVPRKQIFIGSGKINPATIPFTLSGSSHYGKPSYNPGSTKGVFIWQDGPGGAWHYRISNMGRGQGQLRTAGSFVKVSKVGVEGITVSPKPNHLYRNNRNGTFTAVSSAAGVASLSDSRDATWLDYNNDGFLDLFVVNSGNVQVKNQPDQLYLNSGNGTFTNVAGPAGVEGPRAGMGDCAAWADYDRNGFLDLFVTKDGTAGYLAGPQKLYRNPGNSNHWLQVKLVGMASNRHGVGARVNLKSGGLSQTRQQTGGAHASCQNSTILHFGLAQVSTVDVLTVTWPTGQQQILRNVAADRFLTITEAGSAIQATAVDEEVAPIYIPIIRKMTQ